MKGFAIIPIETVVACKCITNAVLAAIEENTSGLNKELEKNYFASFCIFEQLFTNSSEKWPLIVEEKSPTHNNLIKFIESATKWLEHSDFSTLFEEHRKVLLKYLKPQRSFSASGLATYSDGLVINRNSVLLRQSTAGACLQNLRFPHSLGHAGDTTRYDSFLITLEWMRKDPLKRMFAEEFDGTYSEHAAEVQYGPTSDHVSLTDTESVGDMHTPLTTRPTSPALTERPEDTNSGDSNARKPPLPPVLEYIAVIRTGTDKAIFHLDISDVNEKKRRVMNSAKDMCTEMVSKGYEGKVKLQDIMDMAVKMAKK